MPWRIREIYHESIHWSKHWSIEAIVVECLVSALTCQLQHVLEAELNELLTISAQTVGVELELWRFPAQKTIKNGTIKTGHISTKCPDPTTSQTEFWDRKKANLMTKPATWYFPFSQASNEMQWSLSKVVKSEVFYLLLTMDCLSCSRRTCDSLDFHASGTSAFLSLLHPPTCPQSKGPQATSYAKLKPEDSLFASVKTICLHNKCLHLSVCYMFHGDNLVNSLSLSLLLSSILYSSIFFSLPE